MNRRSFGAIFVMVCLAIGGIGAVMSGGHSDNNENPPPPPFTAIDLSYISDRLPELNAGDEFGISAEFDEEKVFSALKQAVTTLGLNGIETDNDQTNSLIDAIYGNDTLNEAVAAFYSGDEYYDGLSVTVSSGDSKIVFTAEIVKDGEYLVISTDFAFDLGLTVHSERETDTAEYIGFDEGEKALETRFVSVNGYGHLDVYYANKYLPNKADLGISMNLNTETTSNFIWNDNYNGEYYQTYTKSAEKTEHMSNAIETALVFETDPISIEDAEALIYGTYPEDRMTNVSMGAVTMSYSDGSYSNESGYSGPYIYESGSFETESVPFGALRMMIPYSGSDVDAIFRSDVVRSVYDDMKDWNLGYDSIMTILQIIDPQGSIERPSESAIGGTSDLNKAEYKNVYADLAKYLRGNSDYYFIHGADQVNTDKKSTVAADMNGITGGTDAVLPSVPLEPVTEYGTLEYSTEYYTIEGEVTGEVTIYNFPMDETTLTIPSELNGYPVTKIGSYSFSGLDSLVTVVFPEGLEEIGSYSFSGCPNLSYVNIPEGCAIGDSAFDDGSYQGAYLGDTSDGIYEYSVYRYGDKHRVHLTRFLGQGTDLSLTIGTGPLEFNGMVLEEYDMIIRDNVFQDYSNIVSVTIGPNVTEIGNSAFDDLGQLISITFDENSRLETIGDYAFRNASAEAGATVSASLPDSVKNIGVGAFGGIPSYTGPGMHIIGIDLGDHTAEADLIMTDGKPEAVGVRIYADGVTELTIASSFEYEGEEYIIKSIARVSGSGMASAVLPEGLEQIYSEAFRDCPSIASLTISSDSKYYETEGGVLFTKGKVTLVIYPAGKTDAEYTIPEETEYISESYWSANLKKLIIGENVQEMSFIWSSEIHDIFYAVQEGNSAYRIADDALIYGSRLVVFQGGDAVTEYDIPDGVTGIGAYAFYGYENLTSVTIPVSLQWVEDYAFAQCTNLAEITSRSGSEDPFRTVSYLASTALEDTMLDHPYNEVQWGNFIYDLGKSGGYEGADGWATVVGYEGNGGQITVPDTVTIWGLTYKVTRFECAPSGNVASIKLGHGISYIYMMNGWTSLESIEVDSGNLRYMSRDGVLYEARYDTGYNLICYPAEKGDEIFTVPVGVSYASIYGNEHLKAVIVPVASSGASSDVLVISGNYYGGPALVIQDGMTAEFVSIDGTELTIRLSKFGYTVTNVVTDDENVGTEEYYGENDILTVDISILEDRQSTDVTADLTPKTYGITFDLNGAEGYVDPTGQISFDEVYTFPSDVPERDGYVFDSWLCGGHYFKPGASGAGLGVGELNATAQWKKTLTVTFLPYTGTEDILWDTDGDDKPQTAVPREGCTYEAIEGEIVRISVYGAGATLRINGEAMDIFGDRSLTLAENLIIDVPVVITYYDTWKRMSGLTGTFVYDPDTAIPVPPSDAERRFEGWYTDIFHTGDSVQTLEYLGSGTHTLYAKWTVLSVDDPSITLNKTHMSLEKDEMGLIAAATVPSDAQVVWTSSNDRVAIVDGAGIVTAVGFGTAVITASFGDVSAECIVKVIGKTVEEIPGGGEKTTTVIETENGVKTEVTEVIRDTTTGGSALTVTKTTETETNASGNVIGGSSSESTVLTGSGVTSEHTVKKDAYGNETVISRTETAIGSDGAVGNDAVRRAIEQAKELSERVGNTNASGHDLRFTASAQSVSVGNTEIEALADSGYNVDLGSSAGSMKLPQDILKRVLNETDEGIVATVRPAEVSDLNPSQRDHVYGEKLYQLSITSGDREIHELGGIATVSLNYVPEEGEDTGRITVYYVNDSGDLQRQNTTYDAASGKVTFTTNHLSYYFIWSGDVSGDQDEGAGGDPGSMMIYIAVAIAAAIAIAAALLWYRRKSSA